MNLQGLNSVNDVTAMLMPNGSFHYEQNFLIMTETETFFTDMRYNLRVKTFMFELCF